MEKEEKKKKTLSQNASFAFLFVRSSVFVSLLGSTMDGGVKQQPGLRGPDAIRTR